MHKLKSILKSIASFFSILVGLFLGFYFWALKPGPTGVLQGATDDTSTQFTIVSSEPNLNCTVKEDGGDNTEISALTTDEIKFEGSAFQIKKCYFENLKSDRTYLLTLLNIEKKQIDQRRFKLLPLKSENFRVGVISCTSDLVHLPSIWNFFFSKNPDILLMIGDNVYSDVYKSVVELTQLHLWNRYVSTWRTLQLFKNENLIPTLGIWDDHDFGVNNGDSRHQGKDFSKFLFDSFFAQRYPNKRMSYGPAISFSYEFGKVKFIFVDGRYFRAPPEQAAGSYFAPEQTRWTTEQLKPSSINWLITGNQWFGSIYQEENFEKDQALGLEEFLKEVNKTQAKYLLVSGDTHFSDVKRVFYLGKSIFEITSSAMHSWPPGLKFPDKRRLVEATNQPNFTIVEFNMESPENMEISTFGAFSNSIYKTKINILEK